jgi:hypothetical protein
VLSDQLAGLPGGMDRRSPASTPGTDPAVAAQISLAFALGWQMAELYRRPFAHQEPLSGPPERLPGISRLTDTQRLELGLSEIDAALSRLQDRISAAGLVRPTTDDVHRVFVDQGSAAAEGHRQLFKLHLDVLRTLSAADFRLGKAYSLGRATADLARPPRDSADLEERFDRFRLERLRAWLNDLTSLLPAHSARAVLHSLTSWHAWIANFEVFDDRNRAWDEHHGTIATTLERQGELWRALLSGEKVARDMLTAEDYVRAGQAMLQRARRLLWQFLSRFSPLPILLFVVLIAAVLIFINNGTSQLVVGVASVATALGITWKGTTSTLGRAAARLEQPLWGAELDGAIAEAVTYLPVDVVPGVQKDLLEETPLCLRMLKALKNPTVDELAKALGGKHPRRDRAQSSAGDRMLVRYWRLSGRGPSLKEAHEWLVWAKAAGYVEEDEKLRLTGEGERLAGIPRGERNAARFALSAARPQPSQEDAGGAEKEPSFA